MKAALTRAEGFAQSYGLRVPILMAPMAGACPVSLAAAVADAGGMGACGALLMDAGGIADWSQQMRRSSNGAFMLNTWIPDPDPVRDDAHEARLRDWLETWGPDVPPVDLGGPQFADQCAAMIAAGPTVMSSIMGLYPPDVVTEMKARGIRWFATVTTVSEARAAVEAGADVLIAQGAEAGGHRGAFEAKDALAKSVGLFSLLPAVVDAVDIPVVAAGGVADGRGLAAALVLGASAVVVGTALLRSPEAGVAPAWADAIGAAAPEDTLPTRAFSGRLGRAIANSYVTAAAQPDAPDPAPYPVQRALTAPMRGAATKADSIDTMQAWAGQSAGLAKAHPATQIVTEMWEDARALLA
ncbi:nitronate monooxygenase [Marivita sp. S6314]|uniref:NAD(P)H-dependent flavin oxidoreductase n=1 Tax=Marivita sp. S6314 TaxID=2926406 RepID=UPI001FF16201|nr:nitronate monooxygenase [Marivita sp. S6314]MCK0151669.1 nitronate monooxygenase [Marivita sp. S6314]